WPMRRSRTMALWSWPETAMERECERDGAGLFTTLVVEEAMKLVTPVTLVVVVFGCTTTPSRLDPSVKASEPPSQTPLGGDERLTRVERRLDKVIAALDQALGPAEPDPASMYAVPVNA